MSKKIVDYIQVPGGTVPKLMTMFKCSKGTVYRALNFYSATEQANNIRKCAMSDFGGVKAKKVRFI